jgi:hypothetical protein
LHVPSTSFRTLSAGTRCPPATFTCGPEITDPVDATSGSELSGRSFCWRQQTQTGV